MVVQVDIAIRYSDQAQSVKRLTLTAAPDHETSRSRRLLDTAPANEGYTVSARSSRAWPRPPLGQLGFD
jgi:hypothetical protein